MSLGLKRLLKGSYKFRFLTWLLVNNFVDLLALLPPRRRLTKARKRVVFARLDGIGDYVIWSQTFGEIRRIYPKNEYDLVMVGNMLWESLAVDETLFDQKIFVDPRRFAVNPRYRFRTLRLVRNLDADVFVNPKLTREFLWVDSLARCSGAPVRIGSRGVENLMSRLQERISNRWYSILIEAGSKGDHELDASLEFLRRLGEGNPAAAVDSAATPDGLEPERLPVKGDYALFFVGAQTSDKRWPIENFAQTAEHVTSTYALPIVICGGAIEAGLAEDFASSFSGTFIDLIGRTSLPELSGLSRSAKLVITNDTGVGHIAALAGVPTVVITPGNHVGRFFPYPERFQERGVKQLSVVHEMPCFGCGWHCTHKDFEAERPLPCITGILPADVNAAIDALMSGAASVAPAYTFEIVR